jgi:hypothetical protein
VVRTGAGKRKGATEAVPSQFDFRCDSVSLWRKALSIRREHYARIEATPELNECS